ncbi:MAG: TIGR02996 domain-containing protein [Gemmataceae bacterium]
MIETLLQALHHHAADEVAWLALADALEEAGDPRAELTRLTTRLRRELTYEGRRRDEARVQQLIRDGITPCMPTRCFLPGHLFGYPEAVLHTDGIQSQSLSSESQ